MKILEEIILWMFIDYFLFLKISGNYAIHLGNISKIHWNSEKDIISLV